MSLNHSNDDLAVHCTSGFHEHILTLLSFLAQSFLKLQVDRHNQLSVWSHYSVLFVKQITHLEIVLWDGPFQLHPSSLILKKYMDTEWCSFLILIQSGFPFHNWNRVVFLFNIDTEWFPFSQLKQSDVPF